MNVPRSFTVRALQTRSVLILTFAMVGSTCFAQPASQPLEQFFAVDGYVRAVAKQGNTLYFGGTFTQVGLRTGGGVPVSATTGIAETNFPSVNGFVGVAIPDGQGGWYIGGSFTLVGGWIHTNLAHIRSDRTVDEGWSPRLAQGGISCLLLDGQKLYVSGSFTNVNDQTRNGLAVLDTVNATLGDWNPNASGTVAEMVMVGTNIYLGGTFTSIGGQPRNDLAVVDKTYGQVSSWNPGTDGDVATLRAAGGHLYVGGMFGTVAAQTRICLAAFDLSTGLLDAWNPGMGGSTYGSPQVSAMDVSQNLIFVGGTFTSIGGSNRVNIAAIDTTTGYVTGWDARQPLITSGGFPSDYIVSLAIFDNVVYVGGPLINIGGQPRRWAAALDINTGDALPWNPQPNLYPTAISKAGNSIYIGGLFGVVGGVTRSNLAAFDLSTKQFTSWNPHLTPRGDTPIASMVVANNQVFVGGFFSAVNGQSRTNLAAIDAVTGAVTSWKPDPFLQVNSLATWNDRLFVAGMFSSIAGAARTNFAEFDLNTMAVAAWDPAIRSFVQTLNVDSNTLYAGGNFSTVSGQTRRRIAAFDLPSRTLTGWNPGITNGSQVYSIAVAAGRVVIGGSFNVINGWNRTNFAVLDAATAQVLPIVANLDSFIYGVAATSNQAFLAGNFQYVNNQKRPGFAAIDLNFNTLASWNPNPEIYGTGVTVFDNTLYAYGVFYRLGGQTSCGIGAFPLALVGAPEIRSGSLRLRTDGNIQFQCTALGLPQATIQVSSNLLSWETLRTLPLAAGNGIFTDPIAGRPCRFYRVAVP